MEHVTDIIDQNTNFGQLLVSGLIAFVFFWGLSIVISRWLIAKLIQQSNTEKPSAFSIFLKGFQRPVRVYLKTISICAFLYILCQYNTSGLPSALAWFIRSIPDISYAVFRLSTIVVVAWGLFASNDIVSLLFAKNNKLDASASETVNRFLSRVYQVIVIAITIVVILSELNYDINGLVASLGLGGLTIALAAQDSAANFFGGLVLVIEKPFVIGDWISCSEAEGTVEDINMRSTSIRTAAGALTVVPNAKLSGSALTNWTGSMKQRRADFNLSLQYGTPRDTIQKFTEKLKEMLQEYDSIDKNSILVRFSDIDTYCLTVRVIFFTEKPGLYDHLEIKESINHKILSIAHNFGVNFAFPTETVIVDDIRSSNKL